MSYFDSPLSRVPRRLLESKYFNLIYQYYEGLGEL